MTMLESIYLAAGIALAIAAGVTGPRFRDANGEPVGFGGWLLIFAASQLLETVWLIAGLFSDMNGLRPGMPAGMAMPQATGTAATWLFILAGIKFVTTLATTALMLLRSRRILVATIAQSVAITVETIARTRILLPDMAEHAYLPIAIAVIVSGIWIAYLALSRRARNTFTR